MLLTPQRRACLVAGLVVALTGACSGDDGGATPQAPATSPTSAPTAASTPDAPASRSRLRLAFAGDVHFEGVLAARLQNPQTALAPAAAALRAADVAVVNLETSVGVGGRPEPGKRFTFSADPSALDALRAAGVDVVSMANNHALDFGRVRLPSTLRAARSRRSAKPPLAVIGIGSDRAQALRPGLVDVKGSEVAVLAASAADHDPTADPTGHWAATRHRGGVADAMDPSHLLSAVRSADATANVVVVYLHWGVQGQRCPSAHQRRLAEQLEKAGADVIVGTHAHRLQGDGRLGAAYVAYGLGNFAWYSPGPTGVLTLTVEPPSSPKGRATVVRSRWWAAEIGASGLATPVQGMALSDFRAERRSLLACSGLSR